MAVGDTPYDIEAAANAGLGTIAVRCGGFPEDTLKNAIAIYDSPTELLRNYDQSPIVGANVDFPLGAAQAERE